MIKHLQMNQILALVKKKKKVNDCSQGWPEGSLFDSYYTKV